jgi:phytoene dehydrogenase-like protein
MIGSSQHFDVVVLGSGLGALTAASLLARRSWRVLVLGQGFRKATYGYEGHSFARRPFTFLAASSPAWRRVLVELAQSQTFRRRVLTCDPVFQLLAGQMRLDVAANPEDFSRELDRELSSVRRVIDELYMELTRTNASADEAFGLDVVLPPGGFWERREASRALQKLPHPGKADLFAELPREHPFRDAFMAPVHFASDLASDLPPFAAARLHGAWMRGAGRLARGEDELVEFLVERVRAYGGEVRLADSAREILHQRGLVKGVIVDGEEAVGASFLVSDLEAHELHALAPGLAPPRHDESPKVERAGHRFVMSMVVARQGLPEHLATEAFVLSESGAPIRLERHSGAGEGAELLVVEVLLNGREPKAATLGKLREGILRELSTSLPFFERHLRLCDSPHDGRPLWDFREPSVDDPIVTDASVSTSSRSRLRARIIERARLRASGGSMEAEPMVPRYRIKEPQLSGLAGEALRARLENAFLTGRSVIPALGQEGELLAAWGVARIITRTDRRREKMLRELWSKVEIS